MSENDFDVQHQRAQDGRDDLVLTGEEIELPGEDSDASAIIGESSAPIHTGEIESVAIGGLTGRVPAAGCSAQARDRGSYFDGRTSCRPARHRHHRRFLRRHGDGGRARAKAGRCARPRLARGRAGLSRSHAVRRIGALGGVHPKRRGLRRRFRSRRGRCFR